MNDLETFMSCTYIKELPEGEFLVDQTLDDKFRIDSLYNTQQANMIFMMYSYYVIEILSLFSYTWQF